MPTRHVVKQGESMDSIALRYGFFPPTIWQHPENRALREARDDMNILEEGDVVFVPDLTVGTLRAATSQRHTFRRRGVPAVLRLRLAAGGVPRGGVSFVLTVDGVQQRGRTDDAGRLDAWVPPNAAEATLVIGSDPPIALRIGHLVPVSSMAGVHQRLNNLGYGWGEADGQLDDATRGALARFQEAHGLPATGEPDAATRAKLASIHDAAGSLALAPSKEDAEEP